MIVGNGKMRGDDVLVLGVTAGNVQRLMKDQPILVSRETHGAGVPDGLKILIVYGSDEKDLVRKLKPAFEPDMKVYVEPRLQDPPAPTDN